MFWLTITAVVALATWLAAEGKRIDSGHHETEGERSSGWTGGLAAFAICCAVFGLGLRLVGLGSSLWTDEFGTLWVVESGLVEAIVRSHSFHGQAPLYYVTVWLFVQLFGESELVLRLPSLLFMAAAALVLYRSGKLLGGVRCGVVAGALLWMSSAGLRLTSEARPYAMAVFFTALVLHGFLSAVKNGDRRGRAVFVLGGAGLVASHFALAIMLLGVGVSYLACGGLRRNYPLAKFSADVMLIVLLCVPWTSQVMGLWERKGDLEWIEIANVSSLLRIFRPELLLLAAAGVAALRLAGWKVVDGPFRMLAICVATQPAALFLLMYAGVNLVTSRYVTNLLVALCLLSAYCIARAPLRVQTFGWAGWAFFSVTMLAGSYRSAGTFTELGRYEWRLAVERLEEQLRATPEAPVLLRTGFIEEELHLKQIKPPESVWAVLRSPGQAFPEWNLLPLSFNWVVPGRDDYFVRTVEPAVEDEAVFYYLSCRCWAGPDGERYGDRFASWVRRELPEFRMAEISAGKGMRLLKFERTDLAGRGAG